MECIYPNRPSFTSLSLSSPPLPSPTPLFLLPLLPSSSSSFSSSPSLSHGAKEHQKKRSIMIFRAAANVNSKLAHLHYHAEQRPISPSRRKGALRPPLAPPFPSLSPPCKWKPTLMKKKVESPYLSPPHFAGLRPFEVGISASWTLPPSLSPSFPFPPSFPPYLSFLPSLPSALHHPLLLSLAPSSSINGQSFLPRHPSFLDPLYPSPCSQKARVNLSSLKEFVIRDHKERVMCVGAGEAHRIGRKENEEGLVTRYTHR